MLYIYKNFKWIFIKFLILKYYDVENNRDVFISVFIIL